MAKASKVSVAFSSDPAGLERGIQRANSAMRSLKSSSSGLERQMASLKRAVSVNSMIQAFSGLSQVARGLATDFTSIWRSSAASIDQLAKLGDASGRTFREMKALQLAGELSGTSVEALAKSMARADLAFFDATQGSASAIAAFRSIGLSIDDLAGLSSSQRFEKIAEAIGALPDPATRTAVAMRLLGRQGQELANFFQGGGTAMREAAAYIEEMGIGLTEIEASNVEQMNDAFTKGSLLIGGVVDKITAGLAPAITLVVDKFGELVQEAGGAGGLGDAIVDGIFRGLEAIGPTIDSVINAFNSMWDFGKKAMNSVIENTKDAIAGLAVVSGGFGLAFRAMQTLNAGVGAVALDTAIRRAELMLQAAQAVGDQAAAEAINGWLVTLREQQVAVGNVLNNAGERIAENVDLAFGAGGNVVEAAGEVVQSNFTNMMRQFREERERAAKDAEENRQRQENLNEALVGGDFGQLFAGSVADFVRQAGSVFAGATERAKAVIGDVGGEAASVVQQAGRELSLAVGSREASNYIARYLAGTNDPKERVAKEQLEVQDRILNLLEGFGLDLGVFGIRG